VTLREQVFGLLAEGVNKTEIGRRLGLSRHQVYRMVRNPDIALGGSGTAPNVTKWGTGAATLVPVATRREDEVVVFGSDMHFPYHDIQAIESFLWMVQQIQPDRVVLNGDIADFFQLSRFNLSGDRIDSLQEEIDMANEFRRLVRAKAPNAVVDETEGNHDSRVITYVHKNAQALKSLHALKPEALFRYRELEINWHPGAGFLLRKHFLVKHGSFVRGEAGASAKAEFMAAGISGISGHTHRLAPYKKSGYTPRVWWEQGCLCRLDPDYIIGKPNWEQGVMVGEFSTKTDSFVLHPVPFLDGKLRFGRESY
jgi:predicted phosphodiesterase